MAITDTLADIWHGLEDKAWGLADFLEDKGIPIASFCQDKGISPVFVFGGILIALILILALVSGAGGGGESAVLIVQLSDENGNPISANFKVTLASGVEKAGKTGMNGKETIDKLPYGKLTVTITESKYKGQETVTISKAETEIDMTAETVKGTLRVIVRNAAGGYINTGSVDIKDYTTNSVVATSKVVGSAQYDFTVPVGVYRVVLKSTSGGELKTEIKEIKAEEAYEVSFSVSEDAANSASVTIIVKDENGNMMPNAHVILRNGRNDAAIGEEQVTDSSGQTVFGNIAMGTSVYPIAFVANDKRYGQVTEYDSKSKYKITVDQLQEMIEVKLPLNGRVDVVVWDKESMAYIAGASVAIMDKAGDVLSTTKQTDSQGAVSFTGFEENVEVYPTVTAMGFDDYENPQDARPIIYSQTTRFTVSLERDGSYVRSAITVLPEDTYGDPITDLDAVLSEVGGAFIRGLNGTDNVSFEVDATMLYNIALYKPGFLRALLEGIGPGTHEVTMNAANTVNVGDVRVCAYMVINEEPSEATANVDLYLSTGALIGKGSTMGGSDGDNCVTFADVPQEWSVYAVASSDAYDPVETQITEVVPKEDGYTYLNITFNQLPQNAAAAGDIKVCVANAGNNPVTGAEVLLYDTDLDAPSWTGTYRLSTASDGCVIFSGLPTEKTNFEGVLTPVMVYPIVSASNYATYNGKTDGNIVQVQPARMTPLNVRLGAGQEICITVKSSGEPMAGADVSLCANAPCTEILETKSAESDGHVIFSSDVTSITVKVVGNVDSLLKEEITSFSLSQVTQGQCGLVDIQEIDQYATVTLDGIEGLIEVEPSTSAEIEFIVRVNNDVASGGAMPTGGQNNVLAADGTTKVLLELTGDVTPGTIRDVDAANGKYALPFVSPADYGLHSATLSASIPTCETCQGTQAYITISVGSGDEDGDGVPDENDNCPGTLTGAAVDSYGCPTISGTDTDGDGIPDSTDQCGGTLPGVQVDSTGCEISDLVDSDGDGYPDSYDAYPNDPNQWYPGSTTPGTATPGTTTTAQQYQNSVQVCVVDDIGAPVYDSSIIMYHTGVAGVTGTAGATGTAGTTGFTMGYSGTAAAGAGMYGNTGQAWQSVYSYDNCRTFMGYSSMQNMALGNFMSSFYLNVNANGYDPYDSRAGGTNAIRLGSASQAGVFTIEIILKRGKGAKIGPGSITDPSREVILKSATWKVEQPGKKDATNIHPLVTSIDKNVNIAVKYSIGGGASDTLDYSVKYTITGNACYEIQQSAGPTALGNNSPQATLHFKKGQESVEDELIVYTKEDCWTRNNPALETEFTMMLEGRLIQIGERESTARTAFTPAKVTIKPIIGATKEVKSTSQLTTLNNMMELQYGAITIGTVPYCISEDANTGESRVASARGVADRTAADQKIVLEFKGTNSFPTTLDEMVKQINDYIRGRIRKSPLDCKAYITVYDKYKGYVEVGQKGFSCSDAKVQVGAKQV